MSGFQVAAESSFQIFPHFGQPLPTSLLRLMPQGQTALKPLHAQPSLEPRGAQRGLRAGQRAIFPSLSTQGRGGEGRALPGLLPLKTLG